MSCGRSSVRVTPMARLAVPPLWHLRLRKFFPTQSILARSEIFLRFSHSVTAPHPGPMRSGMMETWKVSLVTSLIQGWRVEKIEEKA